MSSTTSSHVCPKCGYARKPTDTAPDWQCPACGIVYAKFGVLPHGHAHNLESGASGEATTYIGPQTIPDRSRSKTTKSGFPSVSYVFAGSFMILTLGLSVSDLDFHALPWPILLVIASIVLAFCAYFLLVPDPRNTFPQLGAMLGGAAPYESDESIFTAGRSFLSGKFSGRAFSVHSIPGGGRGGGPNAQTIVEIGRISKAGKSFSVGHRIPPRRYFRSRSDPFRELRIPENTQNGPIRSVEELWNGCSFSSAALQRKFARGRLCIADDEIIWVCYGISSRAETLKGILFFLARIATEVEKNSATWVQKRKTIRIQDYGGLIGGLIFVLMFIAFVGTFSALAFPAGAVMFISRVLGWIPREIL